MNCVKNMTDKKVETDCGCADKKKVVVESDCGCSDKVEEKKVVECCE